MAWGGAEHLRFTGDNWLPEKPAFEANQSLIIACHPPPPPPPPIWLFALIRRASVVICSHARRRKCAEVVRVGSAIEDPQIKIHKKQTTAKRRLA